MYYWKNAWKLCVLNVKKYIHTCTHSFKKCTILQIIEIWNVKFVTKVWWWFVIHAHMLFQLISLLLTRMLSLPSKSDETLFISSSLSIFDTTSQTEPVTWKPFFSHWLKQSLRSTSFREQVCTIAPSPANSSTIAYLNKTLLILHRALKNNSNP